MEQIILETIYRNGGQENNWDYSVEISKGEIKVN